LIKFIDKIRSQETTGLNEKRNTDQKDISTKARL